MTKLLLESDSSFEQDLNELFEHCIRVIFSSQFKIMHSIIDIMDSTIDQAIQTLLRLKN